MMNNSDQSIERINLAVSSGELSEIENWRGSQRPIPNRNMAIRTLIVKALQAEKESTHAQ